MGILMIYTVGFEVTATNGDPLELILLLIY